MKTNLKKKMYFTSFNREHLFYSEPLVLCSYNKPKFKPYNGMNKLQPHHNIIIKLSLNFSYMYNEA